MAAGNFGDCKPLHDGVQELRSDHKPSYRVSLNDWKLRGGSIKAPRHQSHDDTVLAMLKADPCFANEYLAAALEEAEIPGSQAAPPILLSLHSEKFLYPPASGESGDLIQQERIRALAACGATRYEIA